MNSETDLEIRAGRVKLLLMDVDGVLTSGHLYNVPDANGNMVETKGFDSQDGIALQWLSWYGVRTGVISGRNSPATAERARQCKMTYVYQGHIEKIPILEEILADAKVGSREVAYVGDDMTDIVVMNRVVIGRSCSRNTKRPRTKFRPPEPRESGSPATACLLPPRSPVSKFVS